MAQNFVLQDKKIEIPGYPKAFNPSIVIWKNSLLMSFRILSNPKNLWHSQIGVVWLDKNFQPLGTPHILNTRAHIPLVPSRSEDARIFTVGDQLYVIYNDNEEAKADNGIRRMFIAPVFEEEGEFSLGIPCRLSGYEGESPKVWEKNWVPFDYKGHMLLAYSIVPHLVFYPFIASGECETLSREHSIIDWPWGELRGGTPALLINDNEYLAFSHSRIQLLTDHTNHKNLWHYFMGGYTFSKDFPFRINRASQEPIVAMDMYSHPIIRDRIVIFPGGFIFDEKTISIIYGKDDCQTWVLQLDKQMFLDSLIPVGE